MFIVVIVITTFLKKITGDEEQVIITHVIHECKAEMYTRIMQTTKLAPHLIDAKSSVLSKYDEVKNNNNNKNNEKESNKKNCQMNKIRKQS